jgi:cysteine desulfurase
MSNIKRIYFDNAATTSVDPRVNEAMNVYFGDKFGNPSSLHMEGCEAREALEFARKKIADVLDVKTNEVVFTGSGTESDNTAIIGIFRAFHQKPFHMITTKIEHPAVLETCRFIESMGANVTYLDPDFDGVINPEDALKALNPHTRLISIMAANNVTGVFQPISEIAAIAHEHGVLFHTDAVQVFGKTSIDNSRRQIDMMSISAHKLHGPKGVGALIIRERTPFKPLLLGGGQEEGRRSSTQNVAGIIGFAEAVEIAFRDMQEETVRLVNLRNRLWEGIEKKFLPLI